MLKKILKGILWCTAIVFGLGVIGALIVIVTGGKDNGIQVQSQGKSASSKSAYFCDVEGVGRVVGKKASNVGIAIYEIEETDTLGSNQFTRKHAQGKFVVVSVAVANGQKDAITVDASSFKLIDAQGREYEHSVEGQTAIQMSNGNAHGFLTKINPGIVSSFVIPFDVPQKAEISNMELKARGGMTGSAFVLPMKVQIDESKK